jgi:hypothetical protein
MDSDRTKILVRKLTEGFKIENGKVVDVNKNICEKWLQVLKKAEILKDLNWNRNHRTAQNVEQSQLYNWYINSFTILAIKNLSDR